MTISPEELRAVRQSFERLRDDLAMHSDYFYTALFRRAPQFRAMFRDDLAGQGMKFMSTLDVILSKLENEDDVAEQFMGLGRSHASLGVGASHFKPMEEALMDTMRMALGDAFTPALEAAWRSAYGQVAENMIRRGGMAEG